MVLICDNKLLHLPLELYPGGAEHPDSGSVHPVLSMGDEVVEVEVELSVEDELAAVDSREREIVVSTF